MVQNRHDDKDLTVNSYRDKSEQIASMDTNRDIELVGEEEEAGESLTNKIEKRSTKYRKRRTKENQK